MISESQENLLQALLANRQNDPICENDIIKAASFILFDNRKLLESAIEIVGETQTTCSIKQFTSNSCARSCWRVEGTHGREYTCLNRYCSCPNFLQQMRQLHSNNKPLCKHILAIKIATMLNKIEKEIVTDDRFVEILCQEAPIINAVNSKPFRMWKSK